MNLAVRAVRRDAARATKGWLALTAIAGILLGSAPIAVLDVCAPTSTAWASTA